MDWQYTSNQGWPETCGRQVQRNNLASLEPDVLQTLSAYDRADERF